MKAPAQNKLDFKASTVTVLNNSQMMNADGAILVPCLGFAMYVIALGYHTTKNILQAG
ncbi:hypothetical protein [Flavobacterium cerinum]|uniref:Uncharacterized protein n=1 Tax=Flavobacterium cerinum TaxID=2502784 RepID=A0ABY5ITS9_9FLAO|nr:hypothetical protein [Flavobacterium cerinum]UUC46195.1 hypothetical protein NOX80_03075 [Flavobacterium cerinum]